MDAYFLSSKSQCSPITTEKPPTRSKHPRFRPFPKDQVDDHQADAMGSFSHPQRLQTQIEQCTEKIGDSCFNAAAAINQLPLELLTQVFEIIQVHRLPKKRFMHSSATRSHKDDTVCRIVKYATSHPDRVPAHRRGFEASVQGGVSLHGIRKTRKGGAHK